MKRNKKADLKKLAKAFFENLQISSYEFGGIGLDHKRPFGNSSVCEDMLKIIGWKEKGDDGDEEYYTSYQIDYVYDLYHEDLIPYLQRLSKKLFKE